MYTQVNYYTSKVILNLYLIKLILDLYLSEIILDLKLSEVMLYILEYWSKYKFSISLLKYNSSITQA